MTPAGTKIDRALTLVNEAGAPLGMMVTRKAISRMLLQGAISKLEEALSLLKEVR